MQAVSAPEQQKTETPESSTDPQSDATAHAAAKRTGAEGDGLSRGHTPSCRIPLYSRNDDVGLSAGSEYNTVLE